MEWTKREPPGIEAPEAKKAKVFKVESQEPPRAPGRVVLNPADCNLDFNIEGNGLRGSALYEQGFAYCWSGARANVGIKGGKYYFGCKIISAQPVDMEDIPLDQRYVCRLGVSRGDDSVGNLGETENSFGFGGTGKFSNAGKFSDYGEKFGVGDTIVCTVNLENRPWAFIGFFKNGKWLGTAKHFDAGSSGLGLIDSQFRRLGLIDSQFRRLQWESALFPHVLLKNVVVEMQFNPEDGLLPEGGYKPWAYALCDGNAIIGPTFSDPGNCEVMMMVGLPASGKTTWAEKWVKEHPEKRYVLLGTNLALDQMKVPGLLRKQNYGERFDRLMAHATDIFNTLLSRAAKIPRNYILDQTNVYRSARKRKLKPFLNFWKVAVVVFPNPEELKARADRRFKEMGKEVPDEAVNNMLANYVLPMSKDMPLTEEYFDQVIFTESNREESQRYLDQMKHALASVAKVPQKSFSPYSRENSVPAYSSTPMQNQETFSGYSSHSSVSRGHWQSSYAPEPQLNYDCQRPSQVNSAYFGGGPPGRMDSFSVAHQGNQTPHMLNASYDNYGRYDHLWRNDTESRIVNPGGAAYPYRGYGMGGSYSHPDVDGRSFIPGTATGPYRGGMGEPYARPYSTYGEHTGFSGPVGPQANVPTSSPSAFLCSPPTTHGSPYGTPVPRPPYGNYPADMPPTQGYVPPRPKYY